jgi:tetratricopeptide (TPR) repeat protein/transcriptional regulator with XRE-family HTH domain
VRFDKSKLRAARINVDLTQQELADNADISIDTVRRAERGLDIALESARALGVALNVSYQQLLAEVTTTQPTIKSFAVSNIPIRVPLHFLGRIEEISAVDTAFAMSGRLVAIIALHGLRGVGKTVLAAAYAEHRRSDYGAIWWIRAQTESTMRADLVALGVRLGWVTRDEQGAEAFRIVMDRLNSTNESILLIYDNVPDAVALTNHLPRNGTTNALITSNAHAWRGIAEPVEIRVWSKKIGADFLIARTGQSGQREAAEALSEALGGLPLALEHAAAYCEHLAVSFSEYRRRFEAATAAFLNDKTYASPEYRPRHSKNQRDRITVAGTFGLAIDQAAKRNPAAELLILHLALLAPEPLPLFIFSEGREKFAPEFAAALDGDGLDNLIAVLRDFALVDRDTIVDERDPSITTDTVRLHRLVRLVAGARSTGKIRTAARQSLVEAVSAVYPRKVFQDEVAWSRARRLDAISIDLVDGEVAESKTAALATADLLDQVGGYWSASLAAYAQSLKLRTRSLQIREQILGHVHNDVGTSLNNIGRLLHDIGELDQAEPFLERALAIREKVCGPKHALTATNLNNLGLLRHDQGRLDEAKPLLERALAIRESALSPDDASIATSCHNLGNLFRDQGDLDRAIELLRRALSLDERALGAEASHGAGS